MSLRILLLAAAIPLVCSGFRWTSPIHDRDTFVACLKFFGRKPGPMGYFNSFYMAFTRKEAENFPNLVSLHSQMRQIKTKGTKLAGHESLRLVGGAQNSTLTKSRETIHSKRDSNYPSIINLGTCESTIGDQDRLCEVCPVYTDLGPTKFPRYINEVLCGSDEECGVGGVLGHCQSTTIEQEFIRREGFIYEFYLQEIRVCCECGLYTS